MKRFLIFIALLLASIALQAGELVFHWNKMAESKIFDIELMPDNNYFIIVTANEFQVRNTEDGEIVNTYKKNESFSYHDLEFTSDSSKLIVAYDSIIEMRSAKDFSIINTYTLPADAEDYTQYIMEIKVDPIRPYIYVVLNKQKYVNSSKLFKRQILIINSDNFKEEGTITTSEDENLYLQNLTISNDGKYLAVSNEGGSKLMVWSLETQKKLNEFWLCPPYHGVEIWGLPSCIKFSELNSDKIFISGTFPQNVAETDQHSGLFVYSISENKIIDSTFGVGNERIYGSKFTFFDNDNKAMASSGIYLRIINYKTKAIEFNTLLNENIPITDKILYNKENDYFIAYSYNLLTKVNYKNDTDIIEINTIIDSLYPNPTTNQVVIKLNCGFDQVEYKIFNINSSKFYESKSFLCDSFFKIDFSSYPSGIYVIQIECDNKINSYKIIKES